MYRSKSKLFNLFTAAAMAVMLSLVAVPAHASKGDTFENDLLKLIFNATPIANLADNAASSPLTALCVAFHTADPGEAGNQTTNETGYTGYARVSVARTAGGWTVTANSVSPVANIDFGECTASCTGTLTHWSVGTACSGTGKLMYSGTLSPTITLSTNVIPRLKNTSTVNEE